ncbi:MAG: Cof-type HAD-IIB family hydrolase [Clostridiales bacterium]|nr:Cof-type HAD-IIB family hydrolase [Clostridiales bacterium]
MTREIKMIALDLDGTLLDDQKCLSQRNEAALKACAERGIEIVPCTGRNWNGVPDCVRQLPGVHYAITANGAVVEDVRNHKVIAETKLSNALACDILEMAKQFQTVMYDVYIGGQGYGQRNFLEQIETSGLPAFFQKMVLSNRRSVPDIIEEVRRQGIPCEKVNYMFRDPEARLCARNALLLREDVEVSSSYDFNLEINAAGATKGDAIIRLAGYLGIPKEQTMGFGDGENDRTMMKMAGIGVCMANGAETVRQMADYITVTNNEDGVAQAIEKLIFDRRR